MLYAAARNVTSIDECRFYHVMDLPGFGQVGGEWDLRGRVTDYLGHVNVAGKRVLDVGTASGFLTFEMEKLGAEVVSFDADGPQRYFFVPMVGDLYMTDRAAWAEHVAAFLRKLTNSYWLAHRLFGSRARVVYGDVYDIPKDIGEFDVVVVGQILVHLSDPVRALSSIMDRCRERIVITEGMLDNEEPLAAFCARAANRNNWSWWHYSTGLYREILTMAGWEIERIERSKYCCPAATSPERQQVKTALARIRRSMDRVISPSSPPLIELTTIVARRL